MSFFVRNISRQTYRTCLVRILEQSLLSNFVSSLLPHESGVDL